MKTQITLAGLTAVFATSLSQAAVTINDGLSIDGYAISSVVNVEGTPAKDFPAVGESGRNFDEVFVGVTGTYNDLTTRVSFMSVNPFDNQNGNNSSGVLDANVAYKTGSFVITAGKYLGYLGYESFFSPNNAFITGSKASYQSPWSTGVKVDYSGSGYSTGVSYRDSQMASAGSGFNRGDGEFSDDSGFEAFVSITAIENLTLFAGVGQENAEDTDGLVTSDFWASYKVSDKVTVAGEYATNEIVDGDVQVSSSWLALVSYAFSDDLSLAARVSHADADNINSRQYGVAATYKLSEHFFLKSEVSKDDTTATKASGADPMTYALQGQFRF